MTALQTASTAPLVSPQFRARCLKCGRKAWDATDRPFARIGYSGHSTNGAERLWRVAYVDEVIPVYALCRDCLGLQPQAAS